MINHYKKKSTAVHYNFIRGSVSYYLNVFLLFLTLLNFTNLFNANLKYAPLLLIFNLAFLLSYFDSHRFALKKNIFIHVYSNCGVCNSTNSHTYPSA